MRTKYILILIIILQSLNLLFSDDRLVLEYNQRAKSSVEVDPSSSLFYANKSIDENIDKKMWEEYVNSLYIKALSYNILEEDLFTLSYLEKADDFLNTNNLIYKNYEYYVFYGKTLYTFEKYEKLKSLLSSTSIISVLDDKSLIEFNVLKLKFEFVLENIISFDLIEKTISLSENLDFTEILSEVYVLYGDFYLITDSKKSQAYYLKASKNGNTYYSALAFLKLGKLTGNINYIREAYIISEIIGDYSLTKEIQSELVNRYKQIDDYKSLSLSLENIKYIDDRHSSFLLKQNKKIERFSYEKEKIALELERIKAYNSILILVIISMGIVIIFLIIILSIQSYRLRGYNL